MRVQLTSPPQDGLDVDNVCVYENAVDGSFVETDATVSFDVNSETGVQSRTFNKWDGSHGVIAEVLG